MDIPEIRFAKSGDVHIAYQVIGDGPVDLVFIFDWIWNLELQWENPLCVRFLERLSSFSRLLALRQARERLVGSDRRPRPVHARGADR